MEISPITAIARTAASSLSGAPASPSGDVGKAFADMLARLSGTERATTDLVSRAATGEDIDIHDVVIATQTESLAFQIGVQVRNKVVEAYQEVFRMQV